MSGSSLFPFLGDRFDPVDSETWGPGQLIVVEWLDSSIQSSQVGVDEYPKPELIRSVGWLVVNEEDHVVLARDDHKDGEYRGLIAIPREAIRNEGRLP